MVGNITAEIIYNLCKLGFEITEVENIGYHFMYMGKDVFYCIANDDGSSLKLVLVEKREIISTDITRIFTVLNTINNTVRYVKASLIDYETVWLTCEQSICTKEESLADLLQISICSLYQASILFNNKIHTESTHKGIINIEESV